MNNTLSRPAQLGVFWGRLICWISASTVAPIAVFASKFGLFSEQHYEPMYDELGNVINATPPALNGWGIVSCMIIGLTITSILKEVVKAYSGYSLPKQVLTGIVNSVLPLVVCFGICYFLEGVLDSVKYCLIILIITKLIAIPLNPLPKWRYEKNGVENYDEFINTVIKHFKKEG